MSKQSQVTIRFSNQNKLNTQNQQQFKDYHVKSHLLPKIHKTTALAKARYNDHHYDMSTKIVINESDQNQKRQKMALIINDYLQNFRSKQKGSFLAFSSQKNKLQQKPIIVQGVSHSRFLGLQSFTQNKKSYSIDMKARVRTKGNSTILQKLKNSCKVDNKKANQRFSTQPDKKLDSTLNLKGFVLKAKKSFMDCRQKSEQKKVKAKNSSKIQPWVTQF